MTTIVAVAVGLAVLVFLIFAGWPLYNTYRNRGQGADVRDAHAYLEAKDEYEDAVADHDAATPPSPPDGGGPAGREPGDTPLRPKLDPTDQGHDAR